jgi:hypothetical protein
MLQTIQRTPELKKGMGNANGQIGSGRQCVCHRRREGLPQSRHPLPGRSYWAKQEKQRAQLDLEATNTDAGLLYLCLFASPMGGKHGWRA